MKEKLLVPVEFVFEIEGDLEKACDAIKEQIINDGNAYYVDDDSRAQMISIEIMKYEEVK